MIDLLMGVPKQLADLLTRLSATWAAKVDTLHDSRLTAGRAGYLDKLNLAGKATDDAVWTNAKAGYLDMAVSGVARIKNIQYGTVSVPFNNYSATATITTVDTAKTVLIMLGFSTAAGTTDASIIYPRITLTNTTTVTATRGGNTSTGTLTVGFVAVEFY